MKEIYKYTTQKIVKFQILNMCYPWGLGSKGIRRYMKFDNFCCPFSETGIFIDLVSFKDWAPLNTALSFKEPDHLASGLRDPGRFLGSI